MGLFENMNILLIVFISITVPLVVVFLFKALITVPQGQQYTIERFGQYRRTLRPGLNFIMPFLDIIGKKISMMEELVEIPTLDVITQDNAIIKVDGLIFYRVIDASLAAYEVSDYLQAISDLSTTNIRTVMGGMPLDELLSRRDEINTRLLVAVDKATEKWGVKVIRVEIKDITPPEDVAKAMAQQLTAERRKRAVILEAEGRKEAAQLDAQARERLASAEAKAVRMMAHAVGAGNTKAVSYLIGEKYIAALEKLATAENQKIILMPLELSGVISTLGGLNEITKEALSDTPTQPHPTSPPEAG